LAGRKRYTLDARISSALASTGTTHAHHLQILLTRTRCHTLHCYRPPKTILPSHLACQFGSFQDLQLQQLGRQVLATRPVHTAASDSARSGASLSSCYHRRDDSARLVASASNVLLPRYVVSRRGRAGTSWRVPLIHRGCAANQGAGEVSSPHAAKASAKPCPPLVHCCQRSSGVPLHRDAGFRFFVQDKVPPRFGKSSHMRLAHLD
jgi:hypothetical protein